MYVELGVPKRVLITDTKKDIVTFINNNNGFVNLYITVYKFEKMRGRKIDYSTAQIDKIFFDFDSPNCYQHMMKLHNYLVLNDIKHKVNFSGRGFHIFIYTKGNPINKKVAIYNAQMHFITKLGLKAERGDKGDVDEQILGDIARIYRIPNTYNVKRGRFCIPLNKIQLDSGFNRILQLAKNQNFVDEKETIFGRNEVDLHQFDGKEDITVEGLKMHFDFSIKDLENVSFTFDFEVPICMKNLLLKQDLRYDERMILILYLREKGLTLSETIKVLKDNLSTNKFQHCIFEERQPQYLYNRQDLLFPNCETIAKKGCCPFLNQQIRCKDKDNLVYVI